MHLVTTFSAVGLLMAASEGYAQGPCAVPPIYPTYQPVVPDSEAKAHVGEVVTVEGCAVRFGLSLDSVASRISVLGVRAFAVRAFLDFGAPRPHQTFSAIIAVPGPLDPVTLQAWKGKRVRVTGQIRLVDGRPTILLTSPKQLRGSGWYVFPADRRQFDRRPHGRTTASATRSATVLRDAPLRRLGGAELAVVL